MHTSCSTVIVSASMTNTAAYFIYLLGPCVADWPHRTTLPSTRAGVEVQYFPKATRATSVSDPSAAITSLWSVPL